MSVTIHNGDALAVLRTMDADSVQCCVTSPPYFGLRDYGHAGQIGLEPTPAEYVAKLVEVFEEVRRVLKEDGTLWLNLGDSYANDTKWGGQTSGKRAASLHGKTPLIRAKRSLGLKSKDLIGIPWRVAFALQAAGWYALCVEWIERGDRPEPDAHAQARTIAELRECIEAVATGERVSCPKCNGAMPCMCEHRTN
jgi:hypothetical protein